MDDVRELVRREKQHSVSNRELKHRLLGYGFKLEETEKGFTVSAMRGGEPLLKL